MALYAFDGTWNVRDLKDAILTVQPSQYGADASFRRDTLETNVHRFREFIGGADCEYLQGVGTGFSLLGRIVGGAFGAGAKWRIRTMYRGLCRRYHAGDRDIDIVGFSRGAATAVHLANVIAERGIPRPDGAKYFAWHWEPLLGWSWRMPKPVPAAAQTAAPIRFLGLFDTVASIGLPIWPFRNRPTRRWRVTTIPSNVLHSFHAMALDEVRATFALIRPMRVDGNADRHYELWFRGVHSNIGGGYPDRGLSDIALAWMMEMYLWTLDQRCDTFRIPPAFGDALERLYPRALDTVPPQEAEAVVAPVGSTPAAAAPASSAHNQAAVPTGNLETLEPNPDGELGRPSDLRLQAWRAMPANALIHHSVFRRTKNLMLDYHRANRRLLRPIPGDARPVYDPPYFNQPTPRDEVEAIALEAFYRVPVRAASWFLVGGKHVVRSDDWLGVGQRRRDVTGALKRDLFVATCADWLLNRCTSIDDLQLPATVLDYDENPVEPRVAIQWLIEVLTALEPFVPTLREYRARPAHTDGAVVPSAAAASRGSRLQRLVRSISGWGHR
jgi:T6SS, Phospholipase effector Tle1-like, catalytic domain